MSNKSVCFQCGKAKSDPLKKCSACKAIPGDLDDKVVSMCMSIECLKPENLKKCSEYIKRKRRVPNFKEKVISKATRILKKLDGGLEDSLDLDFSTSYFEFSSDDITGSTSSKTVNASIIGRPQGASNPAMLDPSAKTSHSETWTIGNEISSAEYEKHKDGIGNVYVRYRLLGNRWIRDFISGSVFNQLKALEEGR